MRPDSYISSDLLRVTGASVIVCVVNKLRTQTPIAPRQSVLVNAEHYDGSKESPN